MLYVISRRLIQSFISIFIVVGLVFILFSVIPGNFASSLVSGKRAVSEDVLNRTIAELGLDKPVHERFVTYIGNLVTGDFGKSYATRRDVIDILKPRIYASFKLAVVAITFAIIIGIPIGFISALRSGTWIDSSFMIFAVSGLSIPGFWFGLLMMYLFSVTLGWLPTFGYGDGGIRHTILPAVTLGIAPMALLARTTRAAVLEILSSDFIRTARSKGMSDYRVITKHLARNAFVLILTTLGLQFGSMMGGSIVVEKLFSWPGVGSLLIDSVGQRDLPVVQGCIFTIVLFFIVINTLVDIAYMIIDPRIRFDE